MRVWNDRRCNVVVDNQRKQTMIKRLGDEAVALIDDQRFLPFFRSVQIMLEKKGASDEWAKMIKQAKTKDVPSRYFAKLCKMVKNGTYQFGQKVREVRKHVLDYVSNKLKAFGFGDYHKYWSYKAVEFVEKNNEGDFSDLVDYCRRRKRSQKYLASCLGNMKNLDQNYAEIRSARV